MSAAAIKKLIENHKTNWLNEIPKMPENLVNESALSTTLNNYALTTDMTHAIDQVKSEIPVSYTHLTLPTN